MRHALKLHPDSHCTSINRIEVDVARPQPNLLALHYLVSGTIAGLRLPSVTSSARTDELWRHTCFEVFIAREPAPQPLPAAGGGGYYEFNFSPSTEWAAYAFSAPRTGMTPLGDIAPPRTEPHVHNENFELEVSLDLAAMDPATPLRLALSAVIEEIGGTKSYWALAHPPGRPDFHHPVGFALELP